MTDVFLDGASNTPLSEEVFDKMKKYLSPDFMGNSFSIHSFGIEAALAIEEARQQVSKATKADLSEIYFTSGATEGNNWVIHSIAEQQILSGMERPRVVCGATEHSSVLNACKHLSKLNFDVQFVQPNPSGRITLQEVLSGGYINKQTCLVCIMAVNNETGVENDANQIAQLAKMYGAFTLVDCTQAISQGGVFTELYNRFNCANYFTFSAHKFYGPTGAGCLIAREGSPLSPLFYGGSQEFGKRGGTSNTAGIVGLGEAIKILHDNNYSTKYYNLLAYFNMKLMISKLGRLNVTPDCPNILSVDFSPSVNVDNLAAALAIEGIGVSAGSACDSEHDDITGFNPSHVLSAMGLSEKTIRNTIRVSFVKTTTTEDIDRLFDAINNIKEK